jgi:two-component sensor histidine kinase
MTNAYKYAFPEYRTGTVWVKLVPEDEEKYNICICDDGIGLPDYFNIKDSQSMGMQIVQILVEQIEARLEFNGKNGACFNILFSTSQEK